MSAETSVTVTQSVPITLAMTKNWIGAEVMMTSHISVGISTPMVSTANQMKVC